METLTQDEGISSGNYALDALAYDLQRAKEGRESDLREIKRTRHDIELLEESLEHWEKAISDLADAIATLEVGR